MFKKTFSTKKIKPQKNSFGFGKGNYFALKAKNGQVEKKPEKATAARMAWSRWVAAREDEPVRGAGGELAPDGVGEERRGAELHNTDYDVEKKWRKQKDED